MRLPKIQLLLLPLVVILAAIAETPATVQAGDNCPDKCGNLTIPFPFGMSEGCYLEDHFLITCEDSDKPRFGNIPVLDISLINGEMLVSSWVAFDRYESGRRVKFFKQWMRTAQFPVSYTRNKFTVVGCDTYGYVMGSIGRKYATGCMSLCDELTDVMNGSCSGVGCCQTSIPKGVTDFNVTVHSFHNYTYVSEFNPRGFAFIVKDGDYNFSSNDLFNLSNIRVFPVVLDWTIGSLSCKELTNHVCGNNSRCYDPDNGPGYRCNCSEGYEGNPYLPNGCQDIDECSISRLNHCTNICENINGSFNCYCPKGYHGDGIRGGSGCTRAVGQSYGITIGVSTGFVVLLLVFASMYREARKRNINKLREKLLKQNGGIMLQQLLSKTDGFQSAKIFSEVELNKATNNFAMGHVIGQGGHGMVYKGTLADKRIVAIKKSKMADQDQIEQFVTEVTIVSQTNHPNIVKLLGCCLETPVPLLVYEFVSNNTLLYHLHNEGQISLSWEQRLRIAAETAEALAHMHSTTKIIHRDIKSANILLTDAYTAKVADFGISRFVPLGKTHLTTMVQGTIGYIDPEYFHSGILTEKSDVYSFGVVLVELLTGKNAVSLDRPDEDRSLAMYFISSLEKDCLPQILEERVRREADATHLRGVAKLAKKCLKLEGDKRPTMEEAKQELQALRNFCSNVKIEPNSEERVPLLSQRLDYFGSSTSTGLDSLGSQAIFQISSGGR